jgi:hypothetical protein
MTTMFTWKSVLVGLSSVLVLFVATMVYRAFAAVSSTRATGRGAFYGDLSHVITSPIFWLSAALIFFAVAFMAGKYHIWGHS